MITEIDHLREARRSFVADEELGERATAFLRSLLSEWQLGEYLVSTDDVLGELLGWMTSHGTSDHVRCAVTWDQGLVVVELRDHGGLIPEPHVSHVDAELATRLLALPTVEWGADLDSRGRQLWVAFAVHGNAGASDGGHV